MSLRSSGLQRWRTEDLADTGFGSWVGSFFIEAVTVRLPIFLSSWPPHPAYAACKSDEKARPCTYEMWLSSALKHGHSQPAASRWCSAHMQTGDACKNVGK